jgi:hypothetical protein
MARVLWRDHVWDDRKKPFPNAIIAVAVMIIILFFANMAYLSGSLYSGGYRARHNNILV